MNSKKLLALSRGFAVILTISFCLNAVGSEKGTCMKYLGEISETHYQEFSSTVDTFLNSVRNRDFKTFEQFFREDLEFRAVLPGGHTFDNVQSFLGSQTSWFQGTTGRFEFTVEQTEASTDLGSASARVNYENVNAAGKPFKLELYISFLFRRIEGKWFLIHDQNTVLREIK